MYFLLLKWYARLALKIYCRKIVINKREWLQAKGPLLLAANHPNSFLDGIILTTLFKANIYTLARGDAFKKKWHEQLLRALHLLPVYRTSEGVENLEHNYATFKECEEVFTKGGIVLVFTEGRCINEWHLRPLKKGTARLATSTWKKDIPLTVIPVAFNYSPFRVFGKNVFINFGVPVNKAEVLEHETDGKLLLSFNDQVRNQLKDMVYEIGLNDLEMQKEKLAVHSSLLKKIGLVIPAIVGTILHAPIYYTAKMLTLKYFDNDHYDSAIVSMLMLSYPLYLILFSILFAIFFGWTWALLVLIIMPISAWAAVQLKKQF